MPIEGHTHPWTDITGKPSTFPPSTHSHGWTDITGKPSTFPPSAHSHVISDVTGLQTALDAKMDKPLVIGTPAARTPAFGTAYQTANPAKPSWISAVIETVHTVAVLGTLQDTVELRIGPNAAQVAAGTGGSIVDQTNQRVTAVLTLVGFVLGQRETLKALIPAGHYWSLRRTAGTAATIVSATEQEIG